MKLTCGLAWVALAQAWVWDGGQRLRALGMELAMVPYEHQLTGRR